MACVMVHHVQKMTQKEDEKGQSNSGLGVKEAEKEEWPHKYKCNPDTETLCIIKDDAKTQSKEPPTNTNHTRHSNEFPFLEFRFLSGSSEFPLGEKDQISP